MTEMTWDGHKVLGVLGTAIVSPEMDCTESWCENLPWTTIEVIRIDMGREGYVYLDGREGLENRRLTVMPGSFTSNGKEA